MKKINLKKSFLKDVINLTSGYAVSQLIIIAFSPLLTRIYNPEEFGIFFFFNTTASILSVFATGGYEKAIVVVSGESEAKALFRFSVRLAGIISICYFLIFLLLQFFGDSLFKSKTERLLLLLIPVYSFFFGLFRLIQNVNIRSNRFTAVSTSFIVRSSSQSVIQTGLGVVGIAGTGLVFGSCLGQIISVLTHIYKRKLLPGIFNKNLMAESVHQAHVMSDYPKYRMSSDLLNEVSIQAPVYILKTFFSNAITGLYTFPQKILYQPSKFISQAVADVYFNKASEMNNRNKELGELTFHTYKNLFLLGILPYLIILLWGPAIFSFIFGSGWVGSGKIACYLSPWMFLIFVGSPISGIFMVGKRLRLSFILNVVLLIFRVASLLIGALLFRDATLTIILFSAVSSVYWIVLILYSLHFAGIKMLKAIIFSVITIVAAALLIVPLKIVLG